MLRSIKIVSLAKNVLISKNYAPLLLILKLTTLIHFYDPGRDIFMRDIFRRYFQERLFSGDFSNDPLLPTDVG